VQLYSGLIYRGPVLVRECVRATDGLRPPAPPVAA
jgi:dihydroorotate dehydrogenase